MLCHQRVAVTAREAIKVGYHCCDGCYFSYQFSYLLSNIAIIYLKALHSLTAVNLGTYRTGRAGRLHVRLSVLLLCQESCSTQFLRHGLRFFTYIKAGYLPGESCWRFLHDIALYKDVQVLM